VLQRLFTNHQCDLMTSDGASLYELCKMSLFSFLLNVYSLFHERDTLFCSVKLHSCSQFNCVTVISQIRSVSSCACWEV